jgi:hypothetical protein
MRTTTRRIVTLATCGAAFALPVIAGGTAQAAETPSRLLNDRGASVSIYGNGNDEGAAATLGKGGNSGAATTGNASGAVSGQAKTILIAKLSPAKPYETWDNGTQSLARTRATGSVVALTKVGTTTIVSKYEAVANCDKYTYTYHPNAYVGEGCYLYSTSGTYKAKGAAVAAGLPQTGSTGLSTGGYTHTWSTNGVVSGRYSGNSSCQSFNTSYCYDEYED